nr:unnamed protein product [Callosobruchus analis]
MLIPQIEQTNLYFNCCFRKTYVGNLSSGDFSSPQKAKKNWRRVKSAVNTYRKKIKTLQTTVGALRKRNKALNGLFRELKQYCSISDSSEAVLRATLSGPASEIFKRMIKRSKNQKYTPELRSFALTLSFYSPRAYNYVRKSFNNSLPDLSTISKWYHVVHGSPGFTKEALVVLKLKYEEAVSQDKTVLCNLVLDEMSIRQQVEWTGIKFTGYVDIGSKIESDILPEAKEVLVLMLVCINDAWKIPIGCFFLDGLGGVEKAGVVQKALEFIHQSGVTVTSITFDGAPVNFTMCKYLGANIHNLDSLKPYFTNPVTGDKVYIFLDPSHMIKLVRNSFGSQKYFTDMTENQISWDYLVKLLDVQILEGLHLGTKIKLRHIEWAREKMKVKLATQTLSKSVSDALTYLDRDLKLEHFYGSDATATFIRKFNDLFDISNSRNRFAKYFFKRPLSPATAEAIFSFLDDMSIYIKNSKVAGVPIVESTRKTGFIRFLICIASLTDKQAQDHLELFFGAIRSKGGFNNNLDSLKPHTKDYLFIQK